MRKNWKKLYLTSYGKYLSVKNIKTIIFNYFNILVVCILILIVVLIGCSKESSTNTNEPSEPPLTAPVVITDSAKGLSDDAGRVYFTIVNGGNPVMTTFGVCYSLSQNPTIEDSVINCYWHTDHWTTSYSNDLIIQFLPGNTRVYVRAFATNTIGTSYGTELSFKTWHNPIYPLGSDHAGGKVFYIDSTGEHGLVITATDIVNEAIWGCDGTEINGAEGILIGTGAQNTLDIINGCSEYCAASICANLNYGGYSDWFLPSVYELSTAYDHSTIYSWALSGCYWTSTENSSTNAVVLIGSWDPRSERKWTSHILDMYGGQTYEVIKVRAVRAF